MAETKWPPDGKYGVLHKNYWLHCDLWPWKYGCRHQFQKHKSIFERIIAKIVIFPNGGNKMAATAKISWFSFGPISGFHYEANIYHCAKFHACTQFCLIRPFLCTYCLDYSCHKTAPEGKDVSRRQKRPRNPEISLSLHPCIKKINE